MDKYDLYQLMEEQNFRFLMDEINKCQDMITDTKIDLYEKEKSSIYKNLSTLQNQIKKIQNEIIEMQYRKKYKINASDETC